MFILLLLILRYKSEIILAYNYYFDLIIEYYLNDLFFFDKKKLEISSVQLKLTYKKAIALTSIYILKYFI